MNKRKRTQKNPSGFTIIEVILFFAVSSALMLGIITGITRSISRQRYNDTVNDFAEYIRGIYSDVQAVANGQNRDAAGRTNAAIYGKLLEFTGGGKEVVSYTLSGLAISANFTRLDVLGTPTDPAKSCSENKPTLHLLGCAQTDKLEDSNKGSYRLIWDGKLETTTANNDFSGCLLVVRSPISGVIQTFFSSSAACTTIQPADPDDPAAYFFGYTNTSDIDFCIQSDDNTNAKRRNVRIKANASNSSGVVITELDGVDNKCN